MSSFKRRLITGAYKMAADAFKKSQKKPGSTINTFFDDIKKVVSSPVSSVPKQTGLSGKPSKAIKRKDEKDFLYHEASYDKKFADPSYSSTDKMRYKKATKILKKFPQRSDLAKRRNITY